MKILERDTLEAVMPGTTHRLDMDGVEAVIYYEDARRAHMLLPDGKNFSGSWQLHDDGYSVDWTNGPSASWKLGLDDGAILFIVEHVTYKRAVDLQRVEWQAPQVLQ